jgi:hypothetical protein
VTQPVAVAGERDQMWQNFFWACKLGTVVWAVDTTVWQKISARVWKRVGSSGEYDSESISWPVDVLREGIE